MSERTPTTTLYVEIPPSALFASHWSFFLPELLPRDPITARHEESDIGRRVHVSGDRLNGFRLEIIREYNVRKHRTVGTRRYPIGKLAKPNDPLLPMEAHDADCLENARKDEDEGGGFIDNEPRDDFERVCVGVEAPGPSLNRVSTDASKHEIEEMGRRKRAEVKDCQWWIKQVVKTLVEKGLLLPLPTREGEHEQNPIELVTRLPVH